MKPAPFFTGCVVALTAACQATAPDVLAPEGVGSTWEYLALKYDRNADGAIEPGEYAREGVDFARLDADQDGRLSSADFPDERWARDLGIRDMPPELRVQYGARYAARAVVLAYFQPDPHATELTREALEEGFARLDHDGSGALDASEFANATDDLPWGGPGEAWELLLAAMDAPEGAQAPAPEDEPVELASPDGLIAHEELSQYHASMADKAGILRGSPGVAPRSVELGRASDGPPVGTLAPDFALAPPSGGERARLSALRGKKPVALIFGSYT